MTGAAGWWGMRVNINATLNEALKAFNAGQLDASRALLDEVLAADTQNQPALWGLVRVCDAQNNGSDAIGYLRRLITLAPDSLPVLEALEQHCHKQQHLGIALQAYRNFLQRHPDSATVQYNYGYLLSRAGQQHLAVAAYERAIDLGAARPEEIALNIATLYAEQLRDDVSARLHLQRAINFNARYVPAYFNLGCLAEQQGDREGAQGYFEHCLALDPGYLPALARLADAQRFTDPQAPLLLRLQHAAERSRDPDLHFALGRALEQCGQYDAAFEHFDIANAADRAVYRAYDPAAVAAEFDAIKARFNAGWFAQHRRDSNEVPVFICGMFRSGSTLVEQILAAHSAFTPAGEREFFARLVATELPDYPQGCDAITATDLQQWATRYQRESERVFGCDTRLTDKRPDNFLYLGLIKTLFPAARIIVTRRAWRDIAWSIYATRFGPGQHYATDLGAIRHYIDLQAGLVDHWQSLFGDDLYLVDYETLVRSPKAVIAGLLEFLNEPWEDSCLAFNALHNIVRTESVWQVRQPLYTSSVGRSNPFVALRPDKFS